MYSSQAVPSGNFVFVFLKLDDRVNADGDNEEEHEEEHEEGDNEEEHADGDNEEEEAPGESVDGHLAVLLHADLLQWVKVVRNLPERPIVV